MAEIKGLVMERDDLLSEVDGLRHEKQQVCDILMAAPELNMSNYDESDVSALNDAVIEVVLLMRGPSSPVPSIDSPIDVLEVIVANARTIPDPSTNGATDIAAVPLDDIEAARVVLEPTDD